MEQINLFLFIFGIIIASYGSIKWYNEDIKGNIINDKVIQNIFIIFIGAFLILKNINYIFELLNLKKQEYNTNINFNKFYILGLIYIASVCYTIASYYHLSETNWSFLKALLIALPFVIIEYQFSLRGNYQAKNILGFNAIQITLFTLIFYFINSWILSHFILKEKAIIWREISAFICIFSAYKLIDYKV
jgi:uncharacterized protein (DUF486 family)